jgi:hypothetical protein
MCQRGEHCLKSCGLSEGAISCMEAMRRWFAIGTVSSDDGVRVVLIGGRTREGLGVLADPSEDL